MKKKRKRRELDALVISRLIEAVDRQIKDANSTAMNFGRMVNEPVLEIWARELSTYSTSFQEGEGDGD